MSTFASLIRSEVLRLARKETRAAVSPLRKQIRQLRRKVTEQRQQISQLTRSAREAVVRATMAATAPAAGAAAGGSKSRFSPRWMVKHRKRLGMSREAYAKLLGVSAQSVMGWESGKTRPKQETIDVWARVRQMRVRDLKNGIGVPAVEKEEKPRRRVRARRPAKARRARARVARRRKPSRKTRSRRR
jgi:DNA-binding transcriptional regulator YiaG